jgi:hypothetical protein
MASTDICRDFVSMIAEEMALGVETAVECWISQIECALSDVHLTTLGRLKAVQDVVDKYKQLTGKGELTSQAS